VPRELASVATKMVAVPSITTWTRLEPQPRDGSMQRSLQAQVRDPVWMLARQWQVGEFLGDDAGSPIHATLGVEQRTVTTYRPGDDDAKTAPIDPKLPIEVHVEREAVVLRLRGSVQLGLYFETLVRRGGIATPDAVIAAFRNAFPVGAAVPDPTYAPNDAVRFRALVAGRITDGEALYVSAKTTAAGQTPTQPLPPEAGNAGMAQVLSDLISYRDSLFSEPAQDSAWQPANLDYAFALGSPQQDQNVVLNAPDFPGGHLDWYSFTLQSGQSNPVATANPAQITSTTLDFLPNHVAFRGMPDPRWWNFEDAVTDFGQLDAEHVDLAKLLVMEFALVYGNDWFSVPVPVTVGMSGSDPAPRSTLSRVTTLVVTDTFGVRTLIRPSEQTQVNPGESPWSMYKLSGNGTRSDFILMAPTLGLADDADALEEVHFLRDDMAAMAWAVEHQLQGDLDAPIDAYEMYLQRIKADPPPAPPVVTPGGAQIYYTLETVVPDNWIPLVPIRTPQGTPYLRRGTMEIPTSSGFVDIKARALMLEPGHPYFVAGRMLSRSGLRVKRYFRRTRSSDGTTFVWVARQSGQGRGPGASGLRFDIVRDMRRARAP
jgi:hypothetical protein